MWNIEYNDSNYTAFLQTMAGALNTRVKENSLHIPQHYGDGYMHAITLNDGISVLLSDTTLKREMYMHRNASQNFQYLILQLNETIVPHNGYDDKIENENEDVLKLKQNIVILTNSFMSLKFLLPANMRMRSIKIIFEKKHLAGLFPNEVVETFFAKYFSLYFRQPSTEPMDAEYRTLMNEIVKEEIQHPLKNNFIYNRLMLVLEKFFTGFYKRLQNAEKPLKIKDDDISKLVKVEALLVKDFSAPPPTIEVFSKMVSISPTKLKQDFKAMYGLPMYEYFQKNRMRHAKTLLLEGRHSIKEIGMMVGYSNLGHFAGSFKKEFGILPSDITRQKHSAEPSFEK